MPLRSTRIASLLSAVPLPDARLATTHLVTRHR